MSDLECGIVGIYEAHEGSRPQLIASTILTIPNNLNQGIEGLRDTKQRMLNMRVKPWASLQETCELLRIPEDASMVNEDLQLHYLRYKTGQFIYTTGQAFEMLYVVSTGFLKTVMIDDDGNEQVLSFPMKGDLLGIDGIHLHHYSSEAVALSDCTVIAIPFKTLCAMGKSYPALENAMYGVISRELKREAAMVLMLGSLSAEARVARFIAFLSDRFGDMGYSSKQFNLCMTRLEIGSYLGMQLETVSRTLSSLATMGFISVDQRAIEVMDIHALKTLRRLPPSQGRSDKRNGVRRAHSE
jgi:CRP/FNR family transcriptional regulator